jgi:hypothetical protein
MTTSPQKRTRTDGVEQTYHVGVAEVSTSKPPLVRRGGGISLPSSARTFNDAPDPQDSSFPDRVQPEYRSWDVDRGF